MSVSVAPSATVNFLLDLDQGQICDIKRGREALRENGISLRYLFISKSWLIDFQGIIYGTL